MNNKERLEKTLARLEQSLANVNAAIQNATGTTKAELETEHRYIENDIPARQGSFETVELKEREWTLHQSYFC